MKKDFDKWNKFKILLEKNKQTPFAYPGEIWWCALGLNLGAEIDGKIENFERAVLVLHVYNKETFLALPITSKRKDDQFHVCISMKSSDLVVVDYLELDKLLWIKLTQSRLISHKRLLRKHRSISSVDLSRIKEAFKNHI